ncbi:MAG: hypothetical protein EOS11_22120 [Mesorhizobium sp.]|uniref:hypothetical protein n=1 Tax=Mesorhizobium sp. TaxID=1871066 RepID=UPI000FE4432F|nr:hypothetical protein [Mesorhizobium sp.]RWO39492.1 MAG: hypothetical protein EOS11_22120 [Mesorhizobium sp.]TIN76791.1 MAG: hypothetical protein E5Y09_21105 [Mesorhizobium sp.]
MADKELLDLNGGVGLTSGEVAAAQGLYVVDADGNSRFVSFANLKTAINTDPTVVPSSEPWRGVTLRRTSDLTGVATGTSVAWQAAVRDTDSFWTAGSATRITIPAGITKVRLFGSIEFEALGTAGSVGAFPLKNGSAFAAPDMYASEHARSGTTGFTANRSAFFTSILDVTAGNYFELQAAFNMAGQDQVLAHVRTWFELEVVEASA